MSLERIAWCEEEQSFIRCIAFLTEELWLYVLCDAQGNSTSESKTSTVNYWSLQWRSI